MPRATPRGFTLIELLVVIAIIAILAAILFPVFARARAKAKQAACVSNLKQMGLGWMQYVQDYDETPPPYHYFTASYNLQQEHMMYDYVKNVDIYRCSEIINTSNPCGWPAPVGFNYGGYAYNMEIISYYPNPAYDGIARAKSIAQIEDVSRTLLWADSCCHYGGDIYEAACPRVTLTTAKRHNGGANAVFTDGHAKWMKEVRIQDWTPEMD